MLVPDPHGNLAPIKRVGLPIGVLLFIRGDAIPPHQIRRPLQGLMHPGLGVARSRNFPGELRCPILADE